MDHSLQEIISQVKPGNSEVRSGAITDLALLLEMQAYELSYDQRISRYSAFLGDSLVKLTLNKQDQRELVDFIKTLILNQDELNSSLIWAIGKCTPDVGLTPILEIVDHQPLNFDDKELYQLTIALGNLLFFNDSNSFEEEDKQMIARSNLISFLTNTASIASKNYYSDKTREAVEGLLVLVQDAVR
jgi:hypothetical protein